MIIYGFSVCNTSSSDNGSLSTKKEGIFLQDTNYIQADNNREIFWAKFVISFRLAEPQTSLQWKLLKSFATRCTLFIPVCVTHRERIQKHIYSIKLFPVYRFRAVALPLQSGRNLLDHKIFAFHFSTNPLCVLPSACWEAHGLGGFVPRLVK